MSHGKTNLFIYIYLLLLLLLLFFFFFFQNSFIHSILPSDKRKMRDFMARPLSQISIHVTESWD